MNLSAWLERIQAVHPTEIELGLDRVREVALRMGLVRPAPYVVTVAGTNGKGSTVAMLASICHAAGYRVGTYTSPHILRYNERIRILETEVTDEALCESFARIDAARGELSLSYFEFSTLAGLLLLEEAALDIAVLEVGLGGRLDAVNIVDADLAIVTSIGLDHTDWLGDTRELIGYEKAGIFRPGKPVLCGDVDPPASLLAHAASLRAPVQTLGRDYGFSTSGDTWSWWMRKSSGEEIELDRLPHPGLDLSNAATVIAALQTLPRPLPRDALEQGLRHPGILGRFQSLLDLTTGNSVIVDVAHNGHAAAVLAQKLRTLKEQGGQGCAVRVILAMMKDKDHIAFHAALESEVDFWYIAAFAQARCMDAVSLADILRLRGAQVRGVYTSVHEAYQGLCSDVKAGDVILATGSFGTVADMMHTLAESSAGQEGES